MVELWLWFIRVGFCVEEGFPQGIDSISDFQAKYCISWIKWKLNSYNYIIASYEKG